MAPRIDDQEAVVVSGAPDIQQVQEDPAAEEIVTEEKKIVEDLKAEPPVAEQTWEIFVEKSQFDCFDFDIFDTCCGAKVEKTCDHCGLPIKPGQEFVIRNGEYIHSDFCLADLELATKKHYALQQLAIEEEMKAQARREAAELQKAAMSELVSKAQIKEMERARRALELEELARKKAAQEEVALRRQAAEAEAARLAELAELAELSRQEELERSMEAEKLKKKKGFWAKLFGGCSCKKADSAVDTSKPPLETTRSAGSRGAVETSGSALETIRSTPSKPAVETAESALETTGSAEAELETVGSAKAVLETVGSAEAALEAVGSAEAALETVGSIQAALETVESVESKASLEKARSAESKGLLEKARSAESKAEVETRESALETKVSAAE
jgi:hypothetical protein